MASNDVTFGPRDMERLVEWMRRTGQPQTVRSLARRWLELLREERGIRDSAGATRTR